MNAWKNFIELFSLFGRDYSVMHMSGMQAFYVMADEYGEAFILERLEEQLWLYRHADRMGLNPSYPLGVLRWIQTKRFLVDPPYKHQVLEHLREQEELTNERRERGRPRHISEVIDSLGLIPS